MTCINMCCSLLSLTNNLCLCTAHIPIIVRQFSQYTVGSTEKTGIFKSVTLSVLKFLFLKWHHPESAKYKCPMYSCPPTVCPPQSVPPPTYYVSHQTPLCQLTPSAAVSHTYTVSHHSERPRWWQDKPQTCTAIIRTMNKVLSWVGVANLSIWLDTVRLRKHLIFKQKGYSANQIMLELY